MTLPSESLGIVSLTDVYAEQIRTSERVRIIGEQLPDHESRIRALERWRYSLPVAMLAALGSTALALASYLRH